MHKTTIQPTWSQYTVLCYAVSCKTRQSIASHSWISLNQQAHPFTPSSKRFVVCRLSFHSDYFFSKFFFAKKKLFLQKNFNKMLCLLLLGFFTGSIFGTFLRNLRDIFVWDGFIVFFLIAFVEFVSYLTYRPISFLTKHRNSFILTLFFPIQQNTPQLKKAPSSPKSGATQGKGFFKTLPPEEGEIWRIPVFTNCFKIGLLIGFFVDAFKVGS